MHDIFTNQYRCAILDYLQDVDGAVSLREVALSVEARSPDEYGDRPQGELRDNHILPMAEFGVLDYDREKDVVYLPEDVSFSVTSPWSTE